MLFKSFFFKTVTTQDSGRVAASPTPWKVLIWIKQ